MHSLYSTLQKKNAFLFNTHNKAINVLQFIIQSYFQHVSTFNTRFSCNICDMYESVLADGTVYLLQ